MPRNYIFFAQSDGEFFIFQCRKPKGIVRYNRSNLRAIGELMPYKYDRNLKSYKIYFEEDLARMALERGADVIMKLDLLESASGLPKFRYLLYTVNNPYLLRRMKKRLKGFGRKVFVKDENNYAFRKGIENAVNYEI